MWRPPAPSPCRCSGPRTSTADDEPITLRSVETVSAIDLVMGGGAEEDDSSEQDQDPEPPAAS